MTRYSIECKDGIFLKGNKLLSFAKYMRKNIGKNNLKLKF